MAIREPSDGSAVRDYSEGMGATQEKSSTSILRLHDLRHNHASIIVNSGRTLYEVQQVLGHMNPKVTQRYSHLSTKTMQEASDCVSRVLDGAMKGEGA